MKFLSVADRKAASMVCRSWYQASLDPKLSANRLLRFHCWSDLDEALTTMSLHHSLNVVLESLDNSSATRSQITALSAHAFVGIRSLSLAGCDLTEAMFTTLLSGCTNLEVLDISRCNVLFMTGQLLAKQTDVDLLKTALSRVHDLRLCSIRYLSDATFNRLMAVCPNISQLGLAGNQIVFHSDVYFGSGDLARRANSAVLTFTNLLSFVRSSAPKLSSLDLSRTSITDDALGLIAKIPKLQLLEFHLSHCQELTDKGIQTLVCLQPSLQVLDISECLTVRDSGLESICTSLSELRELNIAKCRQITDNSICKLRSLVQLVKLDLNACYTVTSRGLGLGICSESSPLHQLTSLSLACCSSVRDGFVVEMSACLPLVEDLDLSSCGVGNAGLHAICARMARLKQLRLAWCQDITDNGLLGIRDASSVHEPHCHDDDDVGLCRCTRRHHTSIFNPPKPASASSKKQQQPNFQMHDLRPISNLKHLRLLDLTSCHRLTDTGVANVMSFPELRCLHLSLCPALTDVSVVAISTGVPSLEELHLAQCNRISDAGLIRLTERLHRLSSLNISSCDQLTNRALEALFSNTKGLRHLDVSLCSRITAAAVEMLEHNLGRLVSVQKRLVGTKA
jgi:hypothetical protein